MIFVNAHCEILQTVFSALFSVTFLTGSPANHFYELQLHVCLSITWIIKLLAYRTVALSIYCMLAVIILTLSECQRWRDILALLLKLCSFSSPTCQGEKDKYSLRQTKINGWVQKCTEQQATEEDVAYTGHIQTVCLCHGNRCLHRERNSSDTVTESRAGSGNKSG